MTAAQKNINIRVRLCFLLYTLGVAKKGRGTGVMGRGVGDEW